MEPEEMIRRRLAKPFRADPREIQELLELSARDILLAESFRRESLDWAEVVAYNSMLQAGRALMFHRGLRPAGESHHLTVLAFLEGELGGGDHDLVLSMATLRKRRNMALYTRLGTVSERELDSAIHHAKALLSLVKHLVSN